MSRFEDHMTREKFLQIERSIGSLDSSLRIEHQGSYKIMVHQDARRFRLTWLSSQSSFLGEFWSRHILSGTLPTTRSEDLVKAAQMWLGTQEAPSGMATAE